MNSILTKILNFTMLLLLVSMLCDAALSQTRVREHIKIPDIAGYKTLKCDFHMHTIFSDGLVWPTIRPEEAWRNGLDVISITDHIESLAHKNDVIINHNRSYEIAKPYADELSITLIKGSEITREMPPGHLNAIFLQDASLLETDTWRDAIKAAADQGAFIFWNHPGWRGQQSDGIAKWYAEHTELLGKVWLHGAEVVNEFEYYPEVHRWCLDKKLTMISNSDVHDPIQMLYDFPSGEHRPITLVFAKNNSVEALKEALFARRTAVYYKNNLIGEKQFLEPIFYNSVHIINPSVVITRKEQKYIQISNNSEIDFELVNDGVIADFEFAENITLFAEKTILLGIKTRQDNTKGKSKVRLPYRVKNLLIEPGIGLPVVLEIDAIIK